MGARARRGLAAGTAVGLLILGLVACGDDDEGTADDSSTTVGDTGGGEPETLRIGLVYADLSQFAAINPAYDTGDNEAQALAIADAWQSQGLLPEGVEVELVVRSFDPTDDTTKAAVCQQLAEEDEVFAVLAHRTFTVGAECLAERFQIPTISADAAAVSVYDRTSPYLFTVRSDESTTARNFVAYADEEGQFEDQTIGLFYDTANIEAVDALRDELASRGYEIASEIETGGQGVGSDQDQVAVQRFEADGVTAVIPMIGGTTLTNFMTFADEQSYRPAYLDFDFSEHMVDAAVAGRPPAQIEGLTATSQNRVGDFTEGGEVSPETQACLDNYEDFAGEAPDTAVPESAELNNILGMCSLGEVLLAGLSNADEITPEGLVAGLENIQGLATANWDSISFSADDHSGSNTFRPVSIGADCSCYQVEGDYQEFSLTG
ncbi:MAG TPA: hypothetical protein VK611_08485 [Acidimicrobiales bacterium]|nr:hypothetical protein [Acidimicrobiales bacterium]